MKPASYLPNTSLLFIHTTLSKLITLIPLWIFPWERQSLRFPGPSPTYKVQKYKDSCSQLEVGVTIKQKIKNRGVSDTGIHFHSLPHLSLSLFNLLLFSFLAQVNTTEERIMGILLWLHSQSLQAQAHKESSINICSLMA